jgi:hypothetical protein
MKKCTLATLVMAFLIVVAASCGLAQVTGSADTSKEGSLLIWPRIQTDAGNQTYIVLTNNSPDDVCVKCFWEVKSNSANPASKCLLSDFAMQISGRSNIYFKASDGTGLDGRGIAAGMGAPGVGALKCWAVDPTLRKQISWNHLGGFAIIMHPSLTNHPTSAWQYSAWRFAANVIDSSGNFADGFWVGAVAGVDGSDVNVMNLKASPTTVVSPASCPGPYYDAAGCSLPNAAYDACPKYLTFDFLAEPSQSTGTDGFAFNDVALVPCKADLTGVDLSLKTSLVYTLWNENSLQFTGIRQCADCAYEKDLGTLAVLKNLKLFQMKNLHTPSGRFRVEGQAGGGCGTAAVSTPLVGVISSRLVGGTQTVGTTGSASGKETSDYGYIRWMPTGEYYQMQRH